MQPLPIDPLLPEIVRTLTERRLLVLEAPPGAGKTTRVPRALLDAGLLDAGELLVLEPRRLAARMASRRCAEELGERVGERVGYQVRFEEQAGPSTRVRFVTEGVLTRRLLSDRALAGVSAVLLDEFHERHLQGDVGLALLRRLQREARPDLRLCVMSATLDTASLVERLGAPLLRAEGRRFEVAVEHAARDDDRRLEEQVAGAIKRLLQQGLDGDVLVFVPGVAEIRRCTEALRPVAEAHDLAVLPLHGELPPAEQDRAVRPAGRRKVVVSTNVAESSVTIDGVVAVVDSGLARIAGHSPWSGFNTLRTGKVSRASAIQRAGRAGRTRPGRCLRLYTEADFASRPAQEAPEITRLDLSQTVLELRGAGLDPLTLPWFEPPPGASLAAAEELLRRLEAVDTSGAVTSTGRRMARLPLHPRLARLVLEADRRGAGSTACALAALLSEREIKSRSAGPPRSAAAHDSDPVEALELLLSWRARGATADAARMLGLDVGAAQQVERASRQVERAARPSADTGGALAVETALREALLMAYPDRVARRRKAGTREVVFAGGGAAQLSEASGVVHAEWLVAVETEERREGMRGGVVVRSASAIDESWLLELGTDGVTEREEVVWNSPRSRAEAVSRMYFGALVLDERVVPGDAAAVAQCLYEAARSAGAASFCDAEAMTRQLERLRFVARQFPDAGVAAPGDDALEVALRALCEGRRSLAELREADWEAALLTTHAPTLRGDQLDRLAPESVTLPGGRRVKVQYDASAPPWIESRLQDFFGMADGPRLGGRVPLVLHLLAPNGRAQQVTTDLAGFWQRHYPTVRKELMRRYPRHSWPDDPLTATPPEPRGRRQG